MLSSSASAIFRLAGWSYVPDLATRQLLGAIHQLYPTLLHRPPPAPRTPAYATHYRRTFAAVVLAYLSYNLLAASAATAPNFYEVLGARPEADEGTLKMAFRAFARKNHPDRVGQQGEERFLQVRTRTRR